MTGDIALLQKDLGTERPWYGAGFVISLGTIHQQGISGMNSSTDWGELFFSSTGRARQVTSVIAAGVLVLGLIIYQAVTTSGLQWVTGWIVYPIFVFMGACVLSKRLHDRGRSGWWSFVILAAIFMVWPAPSGFFDFLAVIVLAWAVIDLAFMPGERGDNRYGRTLYRGKLQP